MRPWYEQKIVSLWQEDRHVPDRESLREAWERLFHESLIDAKCIATQDFGDLRVDLYMGNRVLTNSYEGSEIGQLVPDQEFGPARPA